MAQHVQDSSVFERRLRPIYDNLEVGNNKKALQETEKLLKKHPKLICARALKGLALLRLGRYEESNAQLQLVSEDNPVDDSTLQVLSFCYKEMEQLDKICDLYNHAAKLSPGNEEILAHLFISYVRLDDYKAQQNVALQLFKAQPKNAYYFWAVMSVVLQGIRGPESKNHEKRKLYLALAERMVDKFISENRLEAEQEVLLYLNILEEQYKFKEALDFLNSPLCEKCYPGAPVYTKINLYKKLQMWKEMNALLRDLLKDEPDRWDFYKDYLTSCFELNMLQESDTISIFDECHDFLCQIIELNVKKPVRGPYLARLELHRRMREKQMNAHDLLGDFTELVIEYFRMFGHKSCCTHDVTLFLSSISLEDRLTLAGKLLLESGISSTTLPQNQDQMQKHICSLQISRICGSHIDLRTEHLLAFYTALRLHYEHGLSTFGKDLLPTDMGPSDDYALLAANVMYDISIQEQKSHRLFEALCLLQYVLKNSPSNFHVKLLCLKIYHIFGCAIGAQQMYDSLDIKHILLDSMGYIHCNLLPLNGRLSLARSVFDSTLKFFTASYKERLEYIALTYRYCAFSKLQEFMDFKDRLTNSLLYAIIAVEAQICDLVGLFGTFQQNLNTYNVMSIEPRDDRIQWNELSDNRDLSAIVRWDPIHMIDTKEMKKESFNQELDLLHIRSQMLRLVSSYVDLYHFAVKPSSISASAKQNKLKAIHPEENDDNSKETDIVEILKDSWDGLFQRIREKNYIPVSNKFLVNILPSKLHLMLELPYEKFFSDLSQIVVDFYTGHIKPEQCKKITDNVDNVASICLVAINESNASDDGLWCRRKVQNRISATIEILSLYAFILSMAYEKLISASQNPHSKHKSKKRDGKSTTGGGQASNPINESNIMTERERIQLLTELMRHLKQDLENCSNAISNWKCSQIPTDLSSYMAGMSLNPEIESTLLNEVTILFKDSHEQIVNEYKNLIKDKIRMIKK